MRIISLPRQGEGGSMRRFTGALVAALPLLVVGTPLVAQASPPLPASVSTTIAAGTPGHLSLRGLRVDFPVGAFVGRARVTLRVPSPGAFALEATSPLQ